MSELGGLPVVQAPSGDCQPPRRLSVILERLSQEGSAPVSIGEIRDALGDRSFAALLVLFAAMNLLPLPIGATLVFGPPLVLVSMQMVLGYDAPWLPRWLTAKTIGRERFVKAAARIIPLFRRMERFVQPRRWPFAPGTADRPIGAMALVLAIAVTLPIPLGNWLPSLSVAIIGLALSERDGVFLAIGAAVGILSLLIIGAVVGAAGVMAGAVFGI
jgi:hypothetical protein